MLSPHSADPTLTTDNFMEVLTGMEHYWKDLGIRLHVPGSKISEIEGLYESDYLRMEGLVDHYIRHYPTPSWKFLAGTLQRMGLHEQADEVTTKYAKSTYGFKS